MPDVSELFRTKRGIPVPAATAEQMREVDRIGYSADDGECRPEPGKECHGHVSRVGIRSMF
jgi:hypothetical protein